MILALTACATTGVSTPDFTGSYKLLQFNQETIKDEYRMTLTDKTIEARFCNSSSGEYVIEDGIIKAEKMASTLMACPESEKEKLETVFFMMMNKGVDIDMQDGLLTLSNGVGKMIFKKE